MAAILTIDNLSKNYKNVKALQGVSFSVPEKTVFGILGPNGSGKTTLLGIVMDVLKASGGTFAWMGQQGSSAIRKNIGTLLETPNFYHYLSAVENLRTHTGRGGWTWYTGASGWMYRLTLETLLGLSLEDNQLRIAPCVPAHWQNYKIHYRYRDTIYHINIICNNQQAVKVDKLIPLINDQIEHFVEIVFD